MTDDSIQLDKDFFVRRKPIGFVLRVDQIPVDDDIENSSSAFNQFRFDTLCFTNRIRQTDGIRCVVSLDAIGDGYLHEITLLLNSM